MTRSKIDYEVNLYTDESVFCGFNHRLVVLFLVFFFFVNVNQIPIGRGVSGTSTNQNGLLLALILGALQTKKRSILSSVILKKLLFNLLN